MSAQTGASRTAPPPTTGRSNIGLWLAIAALVVGAVVAVLGVRASVTALVRGQEIEQYATSRSTATYFAENGDRISRSMRRLAAYNTADVVTMREMRSALEARDANTYNPLADRMNARSGAQESLWNTVAKFAEAFDETLE